MKATKQVIGTLDKCYALCTFRYDGQDHIIAASERPAPCLSFDLQGRLCDTLWEGPGGVMTVAQVPGQPILLATQRFYSPDDSANARIVYYRKVRGEWTCELLCELPFVHRFGVLERAGRHYLIAFTLKSAHAFDGDWTCPGRIWTAPLPEDVTRYSAAHPLRLTPLVSGLYKNHGFAVCREGADSFAAVACENGVYKVVPPAQAGGEWSWEQLLDSPASDVLYLDFDGDGERELLLLSPFHGDTLSILKKTGGHFTEVYRHPVRLPFLHAIWDAEIGGRVYAFIGNRGGQHDLIAIRHDAGGYVFDTLDRGAGAANVLHFRSGGKDMLLAANRETDEIALYTLDAED